MLSSTERSFILSLSIILVLAANLGDGLSRQQLSSLDLNSLASNDIDTDQKVIRIVMLHIPPYVNVKRNSTGQVVEVTGVTIPILEWLSRALNFKYILLPENIYSVEDNSAGKGIMSFVAEGKADMILGAVIMTPSRYKNLNYPFPYVMDQIGFLIAMPKAQANIAAVSKPFKAEIWIFISVTLLATTVVLYGIRIGISTIYKNTKTKKEMTVFQDVSHAFQYVFGVLFSQSVMAHKEANRNQKLTIRFLAGAWCVTCFVLVAAYSSVLISFVTSPYYNPLIESVYDIPKDPKIKITVDRGLFPDLVYRNAESGIFKYLGDQIRKDPTLRCNATEQCLDKVRNGSYVYSQGYMHLKNDIGTDLKRTGRCDFIITKERFFGFTAGLALPKHADIELYSRGMLRANEGGLIDLWTDHNIPDGSRCLKPLRSHKSDKIRLGLGGLSGAFVVLAFGCSISVFVFILELVFNFFQYK